MSPVKRTQPISITRTKIASYLVHLVLARSGEKRASDDRLLKVARSFYRGQPLIPLLHAAYPRLNASQLKQACAKIVTRALKHANYPGCAGYPMPKKKKKSAPMSKASTGSSGSWDDPPAETNVALEQIPNVLRALTGAGLAPAALGVGALGGGALGAIRGAARGDTLEGAGRGVIRGVSTTGGGLGGGLLGSYLASKFGKGDAASQLAGIGGGGLAGALGGYLGSGAALGPAHGGKHRVDINLTQHESDREGKRKHANTNGNAPASTSMAGSGASPAPPAAPSMSMQGPASNFGSMMNQAAPMGKM